MEKVDWTLPGMERIGPQDREFLQRCLDNEDIVNSIHCLGWAYWPTTNRGYLDERVLRLIADFVEIQNKPFWDEYEAYCAAQEPLTEDEMICLDELGFTATPTSTTETSASSSPLPA